MLKLKIKDLDIDTLTYTKLLKQMVDYRAATLAANKYTYNTEKYRNLDINIK